MYACQCKGDVSVLISEERSLQIFAYPRETVGCAYVLCALLSYLYAIVYDNLALKMSAANDAVSVTTMTILIPIIYFTVFLEFYK